MEKGEHPVIVTGIPRSGTSNTTRVLTDMGYCMALEYAEPDWRNPDGFYEDINLIRMNEAFISRSMPYTTWRANFVHYMNRMIVDTPSDKWGFKDTRAGYGVILGSILEVFEKPVFIVCKRDPDLVKASIKKCFTYSDERVESYYENRWLCLDRLSKYIEPIVVLLHCCFQLYRYHKQHMYIFVHQLNQSYSHNNSCH